MKSVRSWFVRVPQICQESEGGLVVEKGSHTT
jgi:hypothetical protein